MKWWNRFGKDPDNASSLSGGANFEEGMNNFTPRAQQVLGFARKEADRFHHNFVGTEHVLLGLIRLGQGVAVNVLAKMGVDLDTVRAEVEKQVGQGPDQEIIGNIPYTPRVRKVLALAAKEARTLKHTYVGTEHILLGLLREADGVAARVLQNLGVNTGTTREQILKELDPNYDMKSADANTTDSSALEHSDRKPLDLSKRYDVCCWEGDQAVVHRNVRFKGVKTLFPDRRENIWSEYLALEESDGRTVFVSRASVVKFSEHTS